MLPLTLYPPERKGGEGGAKSYYYGLNKKPNAFPDSKNKYVEHNLRVKKDICTKSEMKFLKELHQSRDIEM